MSKGNGKNIWRKVVLPPLHHYSLTAFCVTSIGAQVHSCAVYTNGQCLKWNNIWAVWKPYRHFVSDITR